MKIKLAFNIPFIPDHWTRYSPRNLFNFARLTLFPLRCSCCGTKMLYEHPLVEHKFSNGSRLMVDHFITPNADRKLICRICLANHISNAANAGLMLPMFPSLDKKFDPYARKQKCGCCGKETTSYKHFAVELNDSSFGLNDDKVHYIEVRLCDSTAWNNGHYCPSCVSDTLRFGQEKTSHFTIDPKTRKMYCFTKYGLLVNGGKLSLPLQ